MNYTKVNYYDLLRKKGYTKKIDQVRTFDGKTLHVKFVGDDTETVIKL